MQITDDSKEQVLMRVQRLRSMAASCGAPPPSSLSLAMELSISLSSPASPSANNSAAWKSGPNLLGFSERSSSTTSSHSIMNAAAIRPLELLPLHPVAQRQRQAGQCRPAGPSAGGFNIDVNQIPSSSDDYGDEDDNENSSGDARPGSCGGTPPSPLYSRALQLISDPATSTAMTLSPTISGCKRPACEQLMNRPRNPLAMSSAGAGAATSDQDTRGAASDEEESGSTRKKLRLSKEQSALLEESFKEHSTLNPKQKNALAKQLNLRPRQVEVWFQNRRARTKLKQTEVDCELLKRCCESLTEENRRLQKELQELRALKVSGPCVIAHDFYMPLPAATLSMCPSCERVATTMDHTRSPLTLTTSSASPGVAAAPSQMSNLGFTQRQRPSAAC